jgi:hypothetical protein
MHFLIAARTLSLIMAVTGAKEAAVELAQGIKKI